MPRFDYRRSVDSKTLLEITELEWVLYEWIDVTTNDDIDRHFVKGAERLPGDLEGALHDYRCWRAAYDEHRKRGYHDAVP